MMYLAIIFGVTVGVLAASKTVDLVLLWFYHRNVLNGEKYLELYDILDDEFHFEMTRNQNNAPETYADYLRLHEQARPKAIIIFRENIMEIRKNPDLRGNS